MDNLIDIEVTVSNYTSFLRYETLNYKFSTKTSLLNILIRIPPSK